MKIYIESKKLKEKTLQKRHPNALVIDVTSHANSQYLPLSPFFPHGNIPIPFSNNAFGSSVEGIWQGLKVFNETGIDLDVMSNTSMKNLKRTVRKFGKPLGHRKGINGTELLDYLNSRLFIYFPIYKWVLDNKCHDIIKDLRNLSETKDIVLLDYTTNDNVFISNKPLSHAFLVKKYIENDYPDPNVFLNMFKKNPNIELEEKLKLKEFKISSKRKKAKSSDLQNQTKLNF